MSWSSVIGQDRVKNILQRSFITGKIPHSYLFHGPDGTGKDATAIVFAKLLNCIQPDGIEPCNVCSNCKRIAALQHPNFKIIVPLPVGNSEKEGDDPFRTLDQDMLAEYRQAIKDKAENPYYPISLTKANTIKINSIREIRKSISLAQAEQGRKVILISQAERMNSNAQNSLLKTLEEPAHNTVIILTTSHPDMLLPTIISRCQIMRFELLREEEICGGMLAQNEALDKQEAVLISKMANGNFRRAQELTGEDLIAQREEMIDILRSILARSPAIWIKDIEKFLQSNDRYTVVRSLVLLNLWVRDALMLQHENAEAIINLDQQDPLEKFISHFSKSELTSVIKSVERSIALVEKNIYLSLVLFNLAFEIKQFILQR